MYIKIEKYDGIQTKFWCKDAIHMEGRIFDGGDGMKTCNNDYECEYRARFKCDNEIKCFGFSWHEHNKLQELRMCTSSEMEPKTDGWRTSMKTAFCKFSRLIIWMNQIYNNNYSCLPFSL